MANVRAQVILATADAIPANFVTNTWAFEMNTAATVVTEVRAALVTFYLAMNAFYSPVLAQNGHRIKFVNIDDPKPQYPFDERTFNFASPPSGSSLPREVAMVASFQADRLSGSPQARRRGRLYIGPLKTSICATDGNPTAVIQTGIPAAMAQFKTDIDAIAVLDGVTWLVWSGVNGFGVPVSNGWTDNAFDTQRSRGNEATARVTWG